MAQLAANKHDSDDEESKDNVNLTVVAGKPLPEEKAAKNQLGQKPSADQESSAGEEPSAGEELSAGEESRQENLVERSIREITALQREMHDLSENLVALGAPFQTVNVLVEMGFNNKVTEQQALMESLFVDADGGNGVAVADREKFHFQLKQLVDYERDMANVRRTAREQGLKLPAVNALTQMIRRNPGDGGKAEINAFLAYAIAYGVELDGIASVLNTVEQEPQSVLPQIDRSKFEVEVNSRKNLVRDVLMGATLTAILLWLML